MKKTFALLVGASLTFGLVAATGVPAEAKAKPKITIGKIAGKTAPYGKSVLVRVPSAKPKYGKTVLSSVVMTVKKGSKTYASRKSSVGLKAGKYKVTTYVTYRTYAVKARVEPTSTLIYSAGMTVTGAACVIDTVSATPPFTFDATCSNSEFDGAFALSGTATPPAEPPVEPTDPVTWSLMPGGLVDAGPDASSLVGKTLNGDFVTSVDLFKAGVQTVTYRAYSRAYVETRKQNLTIKQGKKPGSTAPTSVGSCPKWAPIKGNINESRGTRIYHLPGGRWYKVTDPEICFSSVKAAKKAGYRASKNG